MTKNPNLRGWALVRQEVKNNRGGGWKLLEKVGTTEEARLSKSLWRSELSDVLEGHVIQLLVLVLVLFDIIMVAAELVLHYGCTGDNSHGLEDMLHVGSVSILLVLLFKLFALVVALGVPFFKHFWYALDLAVVLMSLYFELALHSEHGFLLVILSWRIVRVVHGFFSVVEVSQEAFHEADSVQDRHRRLLFALQPLHSAGQPCLMHLALK